MHLLVLSSSIWVGLIFKSNHCFFKNSYSHLISCVISSLVVPPQSHLPPAAVSQALHDRVDL